MNGDIPWHYVALIVIAFITWLFNRIQEATAERRRIQELKRRREEQQTRPQGARRPASSSAPPPLPGRQPPGRPAPADREEDAEDILRDLFEALGGPPRELAEPRRPERELPKPPAVAPTTEREEPWKPEEPVLSDAERAALERVKKGGASVTGARRRPVRSTRSLRGLLSSANGLRQAVVMKEILDTPVALRDDPCGGHERG